MRTKVLFIYEDEGQYKIESIWASKVGKYYRIENIPFFIKNIALGDLVAVESDGGVLYFDSLIESSGNSVVRLIIFNKNEVLRIGEELVKLGCGWEGSHLENLISVNIPKNIPYSKIKIYLDKGESDKQWEYQEACLGQ